jgi:ceramide glucosyltransferase
MGRSRFSRLRRSAAGRVIAVFLVAIGYQLLALLACLEHLRRRDRAARVRPPVSILKPIYGADDHFFPAIASHAQLSYPEFEIVFGIRTLEDTAVPHIQRLQQEQPGVAIRMVHVHTTAPNGKVGSLIDLAREARYDVLVVNDSDIVVERDYLDKVTAPLEDPGIGLVTCLYRAGASSFASKWEGLGISTDFAPSALVAPFVGVNEFGLGSTLAFRRKDLERIGGFEAIADYIADDYQLGKLISRSGKRVVLTRMAVETHLGCGTWKSVWDHQVRWARTIRASRGAYLGLPVTNAALWALLLAATGHAAFAGALLTARMAVAFTSAILVLGDPLFRKFWPLIPLRDLWGFGVWLAGALPGPVIWRGVRLKLDSEGRIVG